MTFIIYLSQKNLFGVYVYNKSIYNPPLSFDG